MATEQRLIDAYKLEDLVRCNSARYHHTDDVIAAIAGQPTVDAVEVVRCKDCKRYMTIHCTCDGCCISENWYCADGERRMTMCNSCIHAPVCGKCKATGGQVGKCEHFAEERKGRWIRRHNETKCSKCQFIYYSNRDDFNYCPNCGARMDGDHHV